ncbi:MAG: outer membrane beta-barrel protein [Candidatus Limnocylindria bacterium]
MLKRILTVAAFAAILVPASSQAVDHTGQWAVGFYDYDAPLGLRYQFGEKLAFDFGLGLSSFEDEDNASTDPNATKNFTTYAIEVGLPITLAKMDRADFFFRPGLLWKSIPYQLDNGTSVSNERASETLFKLHLGAEYHATDNLSLSVGHGIGIFNDSGTFPSAFEGSEPEGSTEWSTQGLGITDIGFRWYFGGGN